MELIKMPLDKHFCLFTFEGFSTFFVDDSEGTPIIKDIPMRFCFNIMTSDKSDQVMIQAEKHFYERFKFYAIKYFGIPVLSGLRFKEVLKQFEKPLEDHLSCLNFAHAVEAEKLISTISPALKDKGFKIQKSPLFVFTRNGVPDLD